MTNSWNLFSSPPYQKSLVRKLLERQENDCVGGAHVESHEREFQMSHSTALKQQYEWNAVSMSKKDVSSI